MAKAKKEEAKEKKESTLVIAPPKMAVAEFRIAGDAPMVQNKFADKARQAMRAKQAAGTQAKKGGARAAKDFDACYRGAMHISRDGWYGIPAAAFRAAMISACRTVDFRMTISKLCIFVLADGTEEDGTQLVRITKGEPRYVEHAVRNETGVFDIRPRPMFDEWEATVRIRFDAERFKTQDIANLLMRAGMQVGIQEGRPDSKKSSGMGWGTFQLVQG